MVVYWCLRNIWLRQPAMNRCFQNADKFFWLEGIRTVEETMQKVEHFLGLNKR